MQIWLILAVLLTLVVSDNAVPEPAGSAFYRLLAILALMAAAPLAATLISRRTALALKRGDDRALWLERFERMRYAHLVLWFGSIAIALYALRWPQLVRYDLRLDGTVLLDELLLLAPVLLPMVFSWTAFYEVHEAARAGQPSSVAWREAVADRARYVEVQLRHQLALWLIPLLALLSVQDIVRLVRPSWLDSDHSAWIMLAPMGIVFLFFPWLLRWVWRGEPLAPGPLRSRLEAVARRFNFRARNILVWRTDGRVVNAAVAGVAPSLRYVFLSDGLIANLTDDEVEAVYGHELGHVVHNHLVTRLVILLAPLSLWLLAKGAMADPEGPIAAWAGWSGFDVEQNGGVLALAALGAYMVVVFGFFSRRLEQQADLFGCRAVSRGGSRGISGLSNRPPPARDDGLSTEGIATFVSALEKLASLNGVSRSAGGWQHASIARRVEFLERVAREPAYGHHFLRRLRLAVSLLFGIVAGSLLYQWLW